MLQDEAERAVPTVEDDGPGIASTERARVFDRFYRINGPQENGAGPGLAIAAQISNRHGATIDLGTAKEDHGLRVTVTFPGAPRPR